MIVLSRKINSYTLLFDTEKCGAWLRATAISPLTTSVGERQPTTSLNTAVCYTVMFFPTQNHILIEFKSLLRQTGVALGDAPDRLAGWLAGWRIITSGVPMQMGVKATFQNSPFLIWTKQLHFPRFQEGIERRPERLLWLGLGA